MFWLITFMKPIKKKNVLFTLGWTLLLTWATQGQEYWEKKPYQEWSEEQCQKLLTKSPWAQSHTLSQVIIQPLQSPGAPRAATNPMDNIESARAPDPSARTDIGRARQARPELTYQAQIRSALPIRQAIVRLGRIRAKYDDLTPEQKKAFDQNAEAFLAKKFPDTLVLYVSYASNVQVDDRELAQHWQSQTTDTLKNFVFLIRSGGEKVPLSAYVATKGAGREFQFVFPRTLEGRPVVQPHDKSLQLEFFHPKIRDQQESRVLISFKVEKMLIDGEAVY